MDRRAMAVLSTGHAATDFAGGVLPALLPFLHDRFHLTYTLSAVLILLYGVVATVLPLMALGIVSLSRFWTGSFDTSTWTLASWRSVTDASGVMPAIWNSVILSIAAAAITLPLAYIAALYLRRQRDHRIVGPILDFVVAMPLSIPAVIFGVGFLLTYTSEPLVLYGTRWVIVLVYITLMIPFATRMISSGLAAIGESYMEAARVSGAGVVRTHLTILAPLLRPTFGGAAAPAGLRSQRHRCSCAHRRST